MDPRASTSRRSACHPHLPAREPRRGAHRVYLTGFVGLSAPIVGAGVALASGISPRATILGFATAVALGIVASAIKLLPGPHGRIPRPAAAQ